MGLLFPGRVPSELPLHLFGQDGLTNPFPKQSLAKGKRTLVGLNQTCFIPQGWGKVHLPWTYCWP